MKVISSTLLFLHCGSSFYLNVCIRNAPYTSPKCCVQRPIANTASFSDYNRGLYTTGKHWILYSTQNNQDDPNDTDSANYPDEIRTSTRLRNQFQKVKDLTKSIVGVAPSLPRPPPPPMPQAIAALIRDAAQLAVESAMEDVIVPAIRERQEAARKRKHRGEEDAILREVDLANVVKMTEQAVEDSIAAQTLRAQLVAVEAMAKELVEISQEANAYAQKATKQALLASEAASKSQSLAQEAATSALLLRSTLQKMVSAATANAMPASVTALAIPEERTTADSTNGVSAPTTTTTTINYSDVDFSLSEMAPPFIDEEQCLVPGEAVIRVEKAPENSRRIFAGIDIMASVDDVWKVLTDYENLQKVVPNLVTNKVMELYSGDDTKYLDDVLKDAQLTPEQQCKAIAQTMKGAKLFQVGGAKVVGINFSARTTLEVREWPNGLPDFAHYGDEVYGGKTRNDRAQEGSKIPLKRFVFPRPFALCTLPHKDISMQSVKNDDGEFRMYQGVWRMQPLPGCAPPGQQAMRLTYAVEISPRPYLPVRLVEGRVAQDLCTNLKAIRTFVTETQKSKIPS